MSVLNKTIEDLECFGLCCDVDVEIPIYDQGDCFDIGEPSIEDITFYNKDGDVMDAKFHYTITHPELQPQISLWFNREHGQLEDEAREQLAEDEQAAYDAYWDDRINLAREGY